jgi:dihydroorotase
MTERFDLVLKGGRVIDPTQRIDAVLDVAVQDGKIAALRADILPSAAKEVVDVRDRLVLPGLIDTHAHVYEGVTGRFGLEPDLVGVRSGTTTLIDQGGPSLMTFAGFRRFIAEPSASQVYAFISAYVVGGLEGHYYADLYGPNGIDIDATVKAAHANADLVKGVKAHAEIGGFARWGTEAIRKASEIGKQAKLPVYYHLGQLWPLPENGNTVDPDTVVPQLATLIRPGDILAHPFTRHPGGFVDKTGKVHPIVREAIANGLKIDVGHGSHFSFAMARTVLEAGVVPDTLGADMHGYNTRPKSAGGGDAHMFSGQSRFSLTFAMTELLALGLSLDAIVPMVTSNCAKMIGMENQLGTLRPGLVADVTVLADERGRWKLSDNEGTTVLADRFLRPAFCLRAGKRFDADADILPEAIAA